MHSTPRPEHPVSVSVVVPAFDEAESLPILWERLSGVLQATGHSYEIVVVDDGSTDDTLRVLRHLNREDPRIRYVSLSRNFGHQAAQIAGIEHSRGAAVITMDADLQHPPSLIPRMLELWRSGYYVVNTRKGAGGEYSRLRRMVDRFFYWAVTRSSGLRVEGSDFRLIDRRVVDLLGRFPEREKVLRGLTAWMGFPQTTLSYTVGGRVVGRSKYSFRKRVSLALASLLSFSLLPLRVFSAVGAAAVALSVALAAWIGLDAAIDAAGGESPGLPPEWALVLAAVGFFGGAQLITLGVLGEYMSRVYSEVKGRPTYLLKETSDQLAPVSASLPGFPISR